MFYRELRWEDAAKLYEENKSFFFLPYDVMPIMVTNPQKQMHENGVSFLALLEAQVSRHGKTTTWTQEGNNTYSGDKCYKIIVEQNSTWYSVIGMWKNEEDAKQELAAYGYKIVG